MSIYFLRHGDLIKIGFSSNLGARVAAIISSIPGKVEFLGHMPGDRDVESHFHALFAEQRFSGEWFHTSERLEAVVSSALDHQQPRPDHGTSALGLRRQDRADAWAGTSQRLREFAGHRWPMLNHKERMKALVPELGWSFRRVRSLYNCDAGLTLREIEAADLDELMNVGRGGDVPRAVEPAE